MSIAHPKDKQTMIIESVELKNYRNYHTLHMQFSPRTNILYGNNAQGKTNILEAVYVCCTTKSHRGSKDKEMIHFHENGNIYIKTICESCQETLASYPEYYEYEKFLQ